MARAQDRPNDSVASAPRRPARVPSRVRLMTIPAKNAAAIFSPWRRAWASDAPATPAMPNPTGSVQGQTAPATMPAAKLIPRPTTSPCPEPA